MTREIVHTRLSLRRGALAAFVAAALLVALGTAVRPTGAAVDSQDPFYSYTGHTALADVAAGAVLNTRTLKYHIGGVPLPITEIGRAHV